MTLREWTIERNRLQRDIAKLNLLAESSEIDRQGKEDLLNEARIVAIQLKHHLLDYRKMVTA